MYKLALSPFHEILYDEWLLDTSSSKYNLVFDQSISSKLDVEKLRSALKKIVSDHLIFNSHIEEIQEILYWVANKEISELEVFNPPFSEQAIFEYATSSFQLDSGPLYRFGLFSNPDKTYRLVLVLHNIILDDTLSTEFIQTVSNYYNNDSYKSIVSLEEQEKLLLQKVAIFNQKIKPKRVAYQKFWHNNLANLEAIDFKFMKADITSNKLASINQIKQVNIDFSSNILNKLEYLKQEYKISPYEYSFIILSILLYRYSSQMVFGISYLVNIDNPDLFSGASANSNIYPCNFFSEQTVLDLMVQYKEFMIKVNNQDAQYYPINDIVKDCNALIPSIYFAHTSLTIKSFKFNDAPILKVNQDIKVGLLADLVFKQGMEAEKYILMYNQASADDLIIQQFIQHYRKLYLEILSDILNQKIKPISKYSLLSKPEYNTIINKWNRPEAKYPKDKTIAQIFEEQVVKTPNNIAVVYEDIKLSYLELNQRANQLAHYLRDKYNICGDDLIALCLNRNEYMLITILAVLKSGGAYVPLDPTYPEERINYILEDTKAKVLIYNSRSNLHEDYNQYTHLLNIDAKEFRHILAKQPTSNPSHNITSSNLAYIIYTSGTTGKPKGVMIEHSGVVNMILAQSIEFGLSKRINPKNCLLYANYVFDAHVSELYTCILNGHTIHIINDAIRHDLNLLDKYIKQYNIEIATIPPALLTIDLVLKLGTLVVAGEPADKKILDEYIKHKVRVINAYGPTEATVCSSLSHYNSGGIVNNIGSALTNTVCYILDNSLNLLPIGVVGELYIGGVGLARGYLNLVELTDERFIANPFQTKEEQDRNINSRLYKTGDLVRYLPDGNIEYIGRNDFQVKIRGFRIELGEIEAKLSVYPGVKQAVVLAKEHTASNTKYLVGYYVADTKLSEEEILKQLSNELPEYMVPGVLVYLDKLPLTINGKLDRKSLLDIELSSGKESYLAPRNDLEKEVCSIYAEVLGIEANQISILDDFFRLGGNSILAIRLVSRLNNFVFEKDKINVAAIFKHKTIANLLDSILSEDDAEIIIIPKLDVKQSNKVMLSFAQERLWFIENYEGGTNAYNIPLLYRLATKTKVEYLVDALKSTVARHEVLHTLIKTDSNGSSYQEVIDLELEPFKIKTVAITQNLEYKQIIDKNVNYIFKLDQEYPLLANILLRQDIDERYLLITIHHIAFDGWSIDIFLRDIEAYYIYYKNLVEGKAASLNLPDLTIQYKDFAIWQRSYLTGNRLEHQLNYWRNKLTNYEGLNLITDYPRPKQIDYSGDYVYFRINKEVSRNLKDLAKDLGVSLYSVMLSGFNLLLRVYSNQDDIVLGTPIANRHHLQLEDLLGFFVNSLALRSQINIEQKIDDYIKQVGHEIIEAQLHQDLPFEKLVEGLGVVKDESRHPLFQVMFGVQSFGLSYTNSLFELIDYAELNYQIAKFDLSVMIDDSQDELSGVFNYATSLYSKKTIEGFIETYIEILRQLKSRNKIKDLNYLSESRYQQIIYDWNMNNKDYLSDITIHQLFEEQVLKTPDNIAVIYEDVELSYVELNQRANQLAYYLRDKYNIRSDDLVALCLNRNEYMLIAILAVLKSGGAYVPLDPTYPEERINYILEDTKAQVLIHNSESSFCEGGNSYTHLLSIDSEEFSQILAKQPTSNLSLSITSSNLAYVIYTSGTTGKPKGVLQLHKNIVRLFSATNAWYKFNSQDVWTLFHSYVFDFSVWEIWGALIYGGKLVIPSKEIIKDTELFYKLCKKERVTVLNQTPSAFYQFIDISTNQSKKLSSLRYVIFGGDALNLKQLKPWFEYYGDKHPELINMYGITETTVHVTYKKLSVADLGEKSYIGRLIPDMKAYILGNNLTPLPVGAIGELYIGGAGLARGYLNLAELTNERFIANPFQTKEEQDRGINSRLYKTGDLVRYLADGNIEYVGRNDFQVKIRGFRIELGEIESKLSAYPGIKQAVVLAKEHINTSSNANKYLAAYYVAQKKQDEEAIFKYLKHELPEYMVPGILVYLDKLPLTINGKLDKKCLPEPEFKSVDDYVAPRNELEQRICNVYAEVLGIDVAHVGIKDDFFRLGGNSIIAIRLVSKLNKLVLYDNKINVAAIFKYKTIVNLLDGILSENTTHVIEIPRLDRKISKKVALSFAQERLWFIESYEGGSNAYNIPILCHIAAATNIELLKQSILAVIKRHEVLHSLIKTDDNGSGYQEVVDLTTSTLLEVKIIEDIEEKQYQEIINNEVNHIFKLDKELPIKVNLLSRNDNNIKYLLIVVHHMAFDGWSIDVFLHDIATYYDYFANSRDKLNLPDLTIQYRDFASWQREYLTEEIIASQLSYWKSKLNDYQLLNLVTDYPRSPQVQYAGEDISFNLDEKTSNVLRGLAKNWRVSLYSVMLSGFNLLLRAYTNQNDIMVGAPIANRHHQQLENMVGFFVNSLALRSIINPELTIQDFIIQIGNEISLAQLHQDLPFEKLVEELNIVKDTSRHPIFQVMFTLQSFGQAFNKDSLLSFQVNADELMAAYKIAKFDLMMMIDDSQPQLRGVFNYASKLFTKATIERYIKTYKLILQQISGASALPIKKLNYLSLLDHKKLIKFQSKFTIGISDISPTIQSLFERQVTKTPNNIALVSENMQLSYLELNQRANQLAHYLSSNYKIRGDDLVALCLNRNEYMLIAILAVLKSGGAYVPIDPNHPQERIKYILEDTHAKVLITNSCNFAAISNLCSMIIIDDSEFIATVAKQPISNPISNITSNNLAYVIYTSGTTGKPKGVMIEHYGAIVRIEAMIRHSQINQSSRYLFKTNYLFDVSFSDIFTVLGAGGTLYITKNIFDIDEICNLIEQYDINICHFVPSQLDIIYVELNNRNLLHKLHTINFSGEGFNKKSINNNRSLRCVNYYGPTETGEVSVDVTDFKIKSVSHLNKITIGFALDQSLLYILDNNLNLLPIGAVGELYIGGAGLARGYLNLAELTDERFIANPFQSEEEKVQHKNARLYKTGDLVRYLADGNIEYIGRNDFQVKIRGFRIELGEIESRLSVFPGIKQAVVLAKEHTASNTKYLVGYYVAEAKLNEEEILKQLSNELPEYMVPGVLVYLDKLPLTINGKLDRKALPEAEFTLANNYIAPRNELEQEVSNVYADVLGININQISMNSDFFRLGGNSILAIKLVSKLNNRIFEKNKITIAAIFKYKTIENLLDSILSKDDAPSIEIPKLDKTHPKTVALSFAQERLWFIENYEGGTNVYNIPMLYKLAEATNLNLLIQAIYAIVARHEVLHSFIQINNNGLGYQEVGDLLKMPLLIDQIEITRTREYIQIIEKDIEHIFRLEEEYPLKVKLLLRQDTDERYLLVVVHHIAFDGWSIEVFLRDIQAYYNYYVQLALDEQNKTNLAKLELAPLNIQYKDFAIWQRNYLSGDRLVYQLNYWHNQLDGYSNLNLVTDFSRPKQINYAGADISFKLDRTTSSELKLLAKDLSVSLYSVMLSGFYLLLRIYSNQDDIVVGTPIANRHHPSLENMIGFFVNSLALRSQINIEQKIDDYIKQVGHEIIEAQLHQDLPFEKLVEELGVVKDESRHPIFQVLFGVQSFGRNLNTNLLIAETELAGLIDSVAKFDLSVMIDDSQDELSGVFNYATSLYSKKTIEGFIETYIEILRQLKSRNKIKDLNYLSESRYQQIIYDWNMNNKDYLSDITIHQLFEEQVLKTPDNIAVVYEDVELSYVELNQRANQLAYYLRDKYNIRSDDLVALCLNRNEYMLIAILAVLKSGGAYVPLDPTYPEERINYILEDTKAQVLIHNSESSFCEGGNSYTHLLSIDSEEFSQILAKQPTSNLSLSITSSNLAYVIYTSGTTGKPKGVLQLHKNIVRLFSATNAWYKFNSQDVWTLFHSYVFDFSVWEIWGALIYGGKLVIPSKEIIKDTELFYKLCKKERVTVLNQTPSAFYQFIDISTNQSKKLSSLRYVIFGGDALNLKQLKPWFEYYGDKHPELINMYGITETTVHVTYKKLSVADLGEKSYIGRLIPDMKAYILGNNLTPLPVGAIGELYIGGAGLARGYLNLAELTNERFIANPFQTKEEQDRGINSRLYKTGDLVRYLADGNIEYVGRNDFQVKIRGFRIELGEIESKLSAYPGIKQAVVLAKEHINTSSNANKYLAAYYVAQKKQDEEAIFKYLKHELPEYMVPSILVYLDKLPLTINGKLDKKCLPEPEFKSVDDYVAPRNELEQRICNVYAEVLGIDAAHVGIKDDFFRLGGDSILSIRLVAKIKLLGINLSVRALFLNRTPEMISLLEQLSSVIENNYRAFSLINNELMQKIIMNNEAEIEDVFPASYLQIGMILEYEKDHNYHIVSAYKINLVLNPQLIEDTFSILISRHAMLRTAFLEDNEYIFIQIQYKKISIKKRLMFSLETVENIIKSEMNIPINKYKPGLFRVIVRQESNGFFLIITTHHAIEDGWSISSLISEFIDIYSSRNNIPNVIPTYAKFVANEQKALIDGKYKNFWLNYLADYQLINTTLLLDNTSVSQSNQIALSNTLSSHHSHMVLQLAKKLKISPDVIFLSIYSLVLSRFFNSPDLIIGTVVNNRLEEIGGDKVFGLHLNTIPLRFKIDNDSFNNVEKYINKIIDSKLAIEEYKIYPYGRIKADLKLHDDIYQCAFNYIHFHIAEDNYINEDDSISELSYEKTNIPLTLNVDRNNNIFSLFLKGSKTFIDINTATRVLNYIFLYLENILDKNSINLLPTSEYNKIFYSYNRTEAKYPKDKTIAQIFEEQVLKTPDNIAVVYEDIKFSYFELNQRANQLAHYLRSNYKIRGDDLVALCLNRNEYMLIAILAVLKSGGAYVPLDPTYPEERINYILEDTNAKVLIHNSKSNFCECANQCTHLLSIDAEEFSQILAKQPTSNPSHNITSSNLAYIIYTSGTTGKPKGVMIEHSGVVNMILAQSIEFGLSKRINPKNCLLYANYVFDAHVSELYTCILNGHTIHIINDAIRHDLNLLDKYIKQYNIEIATIPPALLTIDLVLKLGTLVVAGEPADKKILDEYIKHKVRVINAYGPTEATVCSSLSHYNSGGIVNNIGSALTNTVCYILDNSLNLLPIGVVGELYIGGVGLARGYLNLVELTDERFIANPFQTKEEQDRNINSRLYKTGDLVRYLPDGNIEYIGRNDFQVKIRGFRIELGEIEAKLSVYPGVKQAVVLAKEHTASNTKYLVGYYVADTKLNEEEILKQLSNELPEYMVPGVLVYLDKLPLTINGKVDRKTLPEAEFRLADNYVAPRNELEHEVCEIYANILNLSVITIGINDNFFRLGGNSILAIRLINQLNDKYFIRLKVADVFSAKCVADIVLLILRASHKNIIKLNQSVAKNIMYMIHPASGGCEVYEPLADLLKDRYVCYGIDNYNLYNSEKYTTLHSLANFYLGCMHNINSSNEIVLLGWSMGGLVSLAIAEILEQIGYTKIKVYLLDTIINDAKLLEISEDMDIKDAYLEYISKNYGHDYAQMVAMNYDIETQINLEPFDYKLAYTQIILFKAGQADNMLESVENSFK